MDESPSKRRRLSPRTEVPPPSSPSRSSRPSYASPTRSSMLRNNPEILDRRASSSPAKPSPLRSAFVPDLPTAASQPSSSRHQSSIAASEPAGEEAGKTAPESASLQEPADDPDELSSPTPAVTSEASRPSLAAPPRRSPIKPNPRPLPPPGPIEEEDLGRLFQDRPPRGLSNLGVAAAIPEEPELPPSSPDPTTSTPPRGIHSSPSRWKEGKKRKGYKSSPLKPRSERPPPVPGASTESSNQTLPQWNTTTNEFRKVAVFDPFADKRKEIAALKRELESLNKDLEVTRKENNRIRLMNSSGRTLAPDEPQQVEAVVRRHLMPLDPNQRPSQAKMLTKAALNPMALISYGKAPSTKAPTDTSKDLEGIKSHHPVVMTAEEELPFLQLFSPFEISSKVSMLPDEPDQPQRQHHAITMKSRDVPGLFHSRIEVVVDTTQSTILELKVPALEPSAVSELQPFINKICNGDCNRSMQRNIGLVSWAMTEWYSTAVQRSHFWLSLGEKLRTKGGVRSLANGIRGKREKKRRIERGDEEDPDIVGGAGETAKQHPRRDIMHHMGRQAFQVDITSNETGGEDASLRFEWKIEFDWTGEAQSALSVMVGAPGKCK